MRQGCCCCQEPGARKFSGLRDLSAARNLDCTALQKGFGGWQAAAALVGATAAAAGTHAGSLLRRQFCLSPTSGGTRQHAGPALPAAMHLRRQRHCRFTCTAATAMSVDTVRRMQRSHSPQTHSRRLATNPMKCCMASERRNAGTGSRLKAAYVSGLSVANFTISKGLCMCEACPKGIETHVVLILWRHSMACLADACSQTQNRNCS